MGRKRERKREEAKEVFITTVTAVFGSKGTSDAMILGEDMKEKFRIGATDRFELRG